MQKTGRIHATEILLHTATDDRYQPHIPEDRFVLNSVKEYPGPHHQRSIRLKGYDYAQAGAYFITIVTWQRIYTFGDEVEATHALPLPLSGPKPGSIAAIVGSYKSAVSRRINTMRGMTGVPVWQSNYFEHIVRNERALNRIREYIQNNPARWAADKENSEQPSGNLGGNS